MIAQRELYRCRYLVTMIYVGIKPPEKNIVSMMNLTKNLRYANSGRESGYAASAVTMMPSSVPTTV